jgi:hypothetical protein
VIGFDHIRRIRSWTCSAAGRSSSSTRR